MSAANHTDPIGQRMLAAIMFTDVVEFSRRMNEDEERTLRLVQRDLGVIADFCRRFGGQVVKNTGDGCLVLFTSGVQAVECAQAVQRHFTEHGAHAPARETLQHRIGIHLGDVFMQEGEVMGDGVNIAARLQAEAPPGGICISQALYEVVKTRLEVRTVQVGSRQLRNIPGDVMIYQVVIGPGQTRPTRRPTATPPAPRGVPWAWVAAGAGVVTIMALAVALVLQGRRQTEAPPPNTAIMQPGPGATPNGELPPPPSQNGERPPAPEDRPMPPQGRPENTQPVTMTPRPGASSPAPSSTADAAYLTRWITGELRAFSEANPLVVTTRRGTFKVWPAGEGLVLDSSETGRITTSLERVPQPIFVVSIAAALARQKWESGGNGGQELADVIAAAESYAQAHQINADPVIGHMRRLQQR